MENNVENRKEWTDHGMSMNSSPRLSLKEFIGLGPSYPSAMTKLPEWNGFWFNYKGAVYVFTKEDRLLDTPDYEQYGLRTDHNTVPVGTFYYDVLLKRLIKAMRVRLDEIYQRMEFLPNSREVAVAKTSAQTSFMFLGLELASLGSENPYPESMNPANKKIENPTDKWDGKDSVLTREVVFADSQVEFVKWLRLELQITIHALKAYQNLFRLSNGPETYVNTSIIEATKAKLWLGQQLGNFKKEEDEKEAQELKNRALTAEPPLGRLEEGLANRQVARPKKQKP